MVGTGSGSYGAAGQVKLTFTIAPATGAASSITATGATLAGRVSDNGASTSVSFDYGLTTGYGTNVAATPATIAVGAGSTAVASTLTGLSCNTTYHFRVKADNGTSTTYGSDATFTTTACAPIVSNVSPTTGPTTGGTSVVITGTHLTGATAVSFGGSAADSFTVNSATQITAATPAHAAGVVNVLVTTAGGTATSVGAFSYALSTPTIPPLPVTTFGSVPVTSTLPPIVNMAAGEGPAFMADMLTMLSNALGQPLQPIGQNALGTVTLSGFNRGKLAFVPSNYQGSGDPRSNGIYPLGDGRYQVVRNGQSLTITPALVSLDQLLALLPGVVVTQAGNGVLIATFNGLTYVVQPGVQVQLDSATGSARLETDADGNGHFIDAQGNNQILYPAFADVTALRNALLGLDGGATLSIQLEGTATIVLQGQRYTLVPDLTLGKVPTERVGQSVWQESAGQDGKARYRVVNNQPLGTAQGVTVKP
jgi:hypothetical protein